ncbi:RNA-binding protein Prp24 [Dichomitus squalens LYAD-421 SS1]|uniref:U4/U6 snRNA-associated-splicing factor PRP24 n=1 Tax=Dichomitus squalens (strain LYAD-421) TaxID=732165 RepID=R7SLI0_DICSQ|nr:RNA-binding protein Prp24 [Dichomitus squalens LYAD-421 SS1]EJF56678.1 RNA-binding protein Prp24 [Dichomitus squalens LYAD-421 SS1]
MDVDMNEADSLEALSAILERLTENPYDISLHAEHIRIAHATGMDGQAGSALEMVTAFWAAGDYVWLPLIEHKIAGSNLETPEDLQSILDLFSRAEQDYLSIPILQKHLDFLVERHEHFVEAGGRPDALGEMFSPEWMHDSISKVVAQGAEHLTKSHLLFDAQRDWELERLSNATGEEREVLIGVVEQLLLERLKQPHSNHEETFQTYSSFTTNYKPADQYESLLVHASKSKAQAVKGFQRRENYENSLVKANYSLEGYAYYIASEKRNKKPDLFVLKGLYERAIAEADKRRFSGEANAENLLRSFWIGYVDLLRTQAVEEDELLLVFQRGLRSVPTSGEFLARYIRYLERVLEFEEAAREINAVYERGRTIGPLQADVEQLIPSVLARAGFEKRQIEAGKTDHDSLLQILLDAISRAHKASSAGDPRLRLEKYFSAVCLDTEELAGNALVMWEDATRFYKTSYLVWTAYTEALTKGRMYDDARKVFRDVANKNLDWPEAVWEAWIAFEHLHGTVEQIEDALDRVERAQVQVNNRRAKEAQKAQEAAAQLIAETQAATEAALPVQAETAPTLAAMEVDSGAPAEASAKRKAEDEGTPEPTKKARLEEQAKLKRDRENCTVFVAEMPAGVTEDELRTLFKDCGSIREIKITQLPNSLVATVEFMDRESVPAALTKDKKRIRGQEVAVHLAWKSTLYVTNFPEKADDKFIRTLFGKYGEIFDVRWPSKKFKSTRRFCYVQFTSPTAAEHALELNGTELEESHKMSVFISNPERRKERTDSDADDREVYVAGLSKLVTKEDLENLFKTYGTVKDVRMILDDKGRSKGFAFVEFETENDARAALAANNHELKQRRMAVTLADSRVRAKNKAPGYRAEVRNRSVRVRNLPPNTQEGLLQQALEKHARVKRVEVFQDLNEADVELEDAAEAGKLLLRPDSIVFDGNTLQIVAESTTGPRTARPLAPPAANTGLFVPRAAVSRPRAGLGSKQRGLGTGQVSRSAADPGSSASTPSPANGGASKGQDDFRRMLSGGK